MQAQNVQIATIAAITIGAINLASMGAVYVVFNGHHKSSHVASLTNAQSVASAPSGTDVFNANPTSGSSTDSVGIPSNGTTQTPPTTSTGTTTTGTSVKATSPTGATTKPSGSGNGTNPVVTTPPPPVAPPVSLNKGAPCSTQTPPAGVCQSLLSFNSQKDGNPNWDPTLMATIKQGVYAQAGAFGSAAWGAIRLTINEGTWSGSATSGSMTCAVGALGRTGNIILQLDWNGSKWMVNKALGGQEN
jgi:hypothetical protein